MTDPIKSPTPLSGSEARDEPEVTLETIFEWAQTARMFIAHNHILGGDATEAIRAIGKLELLARRTIGAPTPASLRWALLNDPYCHAAYAYGAQESERRMREVSDV